MELLVSSWKTVVLENYANFEGRARRSEFWYFVLANFIVTVALNILGAARDVLGIFAFLYALAVFVPGLAVGVRRLHDIGKSGFWLLVAFIPLFGFILLIVWAAQDSQRD